MNQQGCPMWMLPIVQGVYYALNLVYFSCPEGNHAAEIGAPLFLVSPRVCPRVAGIESWSRAHVFPRLTREDGVRNVGGPIKSASENGFGIVELERVFIGGTSAWKCQKQIV